MAGGGWITINGTHVMVDGAGRITKGPSRLTGGGGSSSKNNSASKYDKYAGDGGTVYPEKEYSWEKKAYTDKPKTYIRLEPDPNGAFDKSAQKQIDDIERRAAKLDQKILSEDLANEYLSRHVNKDRLTENLERETGLYVYQLYPDSGFAVMAGSGSGSSKVVYKLLVTGEPWSSGTNKLFEHDNLSYHIVKTNYKFVKDY